MQPETWTILKLLKWTTAYFKSHDIEQPRVDAEVLLAHTVGVTRLELYILYDRPLEQKELDVLRGLIQRRVRGEPVAYIVGKKEFWSMELQVNPHVLIPRPETEILVESAVKLIPESPSPVPWRVLDLGTGSGAVILAIASERAGQCYYAVEHSASALEVARSNARIHGLEDRIAWLQGDWFEAGSQALGRFNLIVSNPPYVSIEEFKRLPVEIGRYEPVEALQSGPDGLDAIRLIVREASNHLVPGGWLLFEMGHGHWPAVLEMIRSCGDYREWDVHKDYTGVFRVACARAK
jgi:release factor glutamine methyltransferase